PPPLVPPRSPQERLFVWSAAPLPVVFVGVVVALPREPPPPPPPPLPPVALLYALAAPVAIEVVAVDIALPPVPAAVGPTLGPPVPPKAFAVLVGSGPGPGPAFAIASEPSAFGAPFAPVTVTVSAYTVLQTSIQDTKNKIKASADRHCREAKLFLIAIIESSPNARALI